MKTKTKIDIFSIYSGLLYQIPLELFWKADDGQLPLTSSKTCKKCLNRGYIGFSNDSFMYLACTCVQKNIDQERLKMKFNILTQRV